MSAGGLTLKSGLLELGMLLTGCINTILSKAQNNSYSRGWGGKEHQWSHPWSQSLFMFWGEFLCLLVFIATRYAPWESEEKKMAADRKPMSWLDKLAPILVVPTFLDLLGSSISGIGLLYCSASVWQMLRGSIIVFTCILSTIFLKRKTPAYRWVAIVITICGLVLVGLSSVFSTQSGSDKSGSSEEETGVSAGKTVLGIVLVLVSQLISGLQMVVEEILLKKKDYAPLHIVGMEGVYGTLLMSFIVLPVVYFVPGDNPSSMSRGSYDNVIDAFQMMGNNIALLFFVIIYFFSIAFFNFFGLNVTKVLTAVHRTLIDACRSVFVWAWQLMTFYCINERFGEEWTKYSGLQVAGFVLLIIGTVIYNGILKLPFFSYESNEPKTEESTISGVPLDMSKDGMSGNTKCDLDAPIDVNKPTNDNAVPGTSV
eukprot:m51a1_g2182 putative solute carrier family 35 member f6-like (427) ;mRNA; f:103548-105167